jgi:hypothetical protein
VGGVKCDNIYDVKKIINYLFNIIGLFLALFGILRIILLVSNNWNIISVFGINNIVMLIIGLLAFIYSKKYLNSIGSKVFISSTIVIIIFLAFSFMYYAPADLFIN